MGIGMVRNGCGVYGTGTGVGTKKRTTLGEDTSKPQSKDKTAECMAFLREKSEEILEKLRNGETEVSYQIGAESYTEKEWDKLLKKFDEIQEDVRQKMEARVEETE